MPYSSFLDRLPAEVHRKIATYILAESKDDALSFSASAESHRSVMASALQGKLILTDDDAELINKWISIVGNLAREVDFTSLREEPLPTNFLTLPNLKVASIYGNSDHFLAIFDSPHLKKLSIVFDENMHWEEFISTVSRLPLHELRIKADRKGKCIMSTLEDSKLLALPSACPHLRLLEIDCKCRTKRVSHWNMIRAFDSLDTLILHRRIYECNVPFIERLKEVRVKRPWPIRRLVKMGTNFSSVQQLRRASFDTTALLSVLPHLKEVRVRLLDGAELALVASAASLEILIIGWGYDSGYDELPATEEEEEDENVTLDKDVTALYAPDEDVIEEIVRNAPNLRVLGLFKARIRIQLVEKIMKLIGSRLEVFRVELGGQAEPVSIRIERILATAAQFCPNIKHIEIPRTHGHFTVPMTTEQKENCLASLKVIKRSSPFFRGGIHDPSDLMHFDTVIVT